MTTTVTFNMTSTAEINCNGELILSDVPLSTMRVIDGIHVTNNSSYDSTVDIDIIRTTTTPGTYCFIKQVTLTGFTGGDVLKGSCLYLQPGDSLMAYTKGLRERVDCLISYRDIPN